MVMKGNVDLSQKRPKRYLTSLFRKGSINSSKAVGLGETRPIDSNRSAEGVR